MWEESQRSAIIFSVHRLSIWQTVALEEKVLDDPRKTLSSPPPAPFTTMYTRPNTSQPQFAVHNNERSTSLTYLHHFQAVKRDPVELKYGICMIVFLSSTTTCFVDNHPNCFRIPLGREAKCYNTS